jgi:hypothetical protein
VQKKPKSAVSGDKSSRSKQENLVPLIETKRFFDKILEEKTKKDTELRSKLIEPISLDELTTTKFLQSYPTVPDAAANLLQHLELLNSNTCTEKVIWTTPSEFIEADQAGQTIPRFTLVSNTKHMYAVLINKLYGLSGEEKPHEDVVEYWLNLRQKWNGEKNKQATYYPPTCPYGVRNL